MYGDPDKTVHFAESLSKSGRGAHLINGAYFYHREKIVPRIEENLYEEEAKEKLTGYIIHPKPWASLSNKKDNLKLKALGRWTFAWINFSFTAIDSAGLGLLIKCSCDLSDLYELQHQNIKEC